MDPRRVLNARTTREKRCCPEARPDAIAGRFHADPAKLLVMSCVGQLVADGHAEWDMLDNGDIRLRFNTGERFLLAETVIVRLA